MSTEVLLPKIGFTMGEGLLREWFAEDGAQVREGDLLYALESEKAIEEIMAPASGRLKILRAVGETVEVGTTVAIIE